MNCLRRSSELLTSNVLPIFLMSMICCALSRIILFLDDYFSTCFLPLSLLVLSSSWYIVVMTFYSSTCSSIPSPVRPYTAVYGYCSIPSWHATHTYHCDILTSTWCIFPSKPLMVPLARLGGYDSFSVSCSSEDCLKRAGTHLEAGIMICSTE